MSFGVTAFVITVISTAYSTYTSIKAQKKAKREAEARKGFEIPVEAEIGAVPLVYGRAKIAGFRVFHEVDSHYQYRATGDLEFLTSGDSRVVSQYQNTVIATGNMSITLYNDGGVYSAEAPVGGVWTDETAETVSISLGAGGKVISRGNPGSASQASMSANYAMQLTPSVFLIDRLLPEARVELTHMPWNFVAGHEYEGPSGEPLPEVVATAHNYKIISYNETTGELRLAALFNTNSLYFDSTRFTIGTLANTGSPALDETETQRKRKREFLYIQQVFCMKGIQNVYHVEINNKDWRDAEFGESGRIHIYRDGEVADPMMAAQPAFTDRANARFPETAYGSMVFKVDRDEPQYSGVPQVVIQCEGAKVKTISENDVLSPFKSYSNNPAEVLLDYLLDESYGKGLSANEIDLPSFGRVKRICAELVEVNGSTNIVHTGDFWDQKLQTDGLPSKTLGRFEFNGVLDTSATVRDNIQRILSSMSKKATLLWSQGKYKLKMHYPKVYEEGISYEVGDIVQALGTVEGGTIALDNDIWRCKVATNGTQHPVAPSNYWTNGQEQIALDNYEEDLSVAYIDDSNIELKGKISQSWIPLSDRFNFCTISFPNEEKNFNTDTVSWPDKFPSNPADVVYDTYLEADNGILLETSETVDSISDYHHAKAYAEEVVRSSRHERLLQVSVSRKFFYVEPQDLIHIDSEVLGIPGVVFLVNSVKANSEGSLDLTCQIFNAEVLAWNADDEEVIDSLNPYTRYPVGQVPQNSLTYTPNETAEGVLLRSGTLSWSHAEGSEVSYDVKYLPKPAGAIAIGEEWAHLGSTRDLSFDIPLLAEGIVTFTVIARDGYGNIAPEWDVARGQGWPKLQVLIGASSITQTEALIKIWKFSRVDISDTEIDISAGGNSYDFNGKILDPPDGWYADEATAFAQAEIEYGSELVGNLFFAEKLLTITYPETLVEDIEWSVAKWASHAYSEKQLTVYYRKPAGTVAPNTPGSDIASDEGSYFFGENILTPPTSNNGTIQWTEGIEGDQGTIYVSYATATVKGVYGLNTNDLAWTTPNVLSDVGIVTATLRLYKWRSTFPLASELASTQSIMTWTPSRSHHTLSGANGWSLELPAAPSDSSVRAYEATLTIEAEVGVIQTIVNWSSPDVIISEASNSVSSQNVYVYKWAISGSPAPTTPLTTSTYNWANDSIVNVPAGWSADIPAEPGSGYVLYRLGGRVTDTAEATTTTIYWTAGHMTMSIVSSTGGDGAKTVTAFAAGAMELTFTGQVIVSGETLPAVNAWGNGLTWYSSTEAPSPLPENTRLFMSVGVYDPSTDETTWDTPFWASLTVGSLSAITINTGSLSVTGDIEVTSGNIRRGKTSFGDFAQGFWLGSAGDVHVGDDSSYFRYSGGTGVQIKADLASDNYDGLNGWRMTRAGSANINQLTVKDPATGDTVIDLGNVASTGVNGGYIQDLSVSTLKIQDEAVTVPRFAKSTHTNVTLNVGFIEPLTTVYFELSGLPEGEVIDVLIISTLNIYTQSAAPPDTTILHFINGNMYPAAPVDPGGAGGSISASYEMVSSEPGGSNNTSGQVGDGVYMNSMWWDSYLGTYGGLGSYDINTNADVYTNFEITITPYWAGGTGDVIQSISGVLELDLLNTDLMGNRAIAEAMLYVNGGGGSTTVDVTDLHFSSADASAHTVTLPFTVDISSANISGPVYDLDLNIAANAGGFGVDAIYPTRARLYDVLINIGGEPVEDPDAIVLPTVDPVPFTSAQVGISTLQNNGINSVATGIISMGNGQAEITTGVSMRDDQGNGATSRSNMTLQCAMTVLGGKR